MKTSAILFAVLAGGMGASSLAVAQGDAFYDEWGRPRAEWQAGNQAHGRPNEGQAAIDQQQNWQRNYNYRNYVNPGYVQRNYQQNYGARNHGYNRGSYLPREYRQQRYYVQNWNAYPGLYAPPRGHQWVQVGSDFALMSTNSGRIVSLLSGNG